jgi:hypothetical protein
MITLAQFGAVPLPAVPVSAMQRSGVPSSFTVQGTTLSATTVNDPRQTPDPSCILAIFGAIPDVAKSTIYASGPGATLGQQVNGTIAAWKAAYPWMPDRPFPLVYSYPTNALYVLTPQQGTGWDPQFYNPAHPIFGPDDPRAVPFSAAVHLFYPDKLYQTGGDSPGLDLAQGANGSMVGSQPWPYWLRVVSPNMVSFAVKYLQSDGTPLGQAVRKSFDWGQVLASGIRGGASGATTGNPYVAAGAAAGSAIVSVFSQLLGGDPTPPKWLTDLLPMAAIRESTGGRFIQSATGSTVYCHKLTVVRETGMTLLDGYYAVLQGLAGGGGLDLSSIPWWGWALGAGALLTLLD